MEEGENQGSVMPDEDEPVTEDKPVVEDKPASEKTTEELAREDEQRTGNP
jgi:hypothetical protein